MQTISCIPASENSQIAPRLADGLLIVYNLFRSVKVSYLDFELNLEGCLDHIPTDIHDMYISSYPDGCSFPGLPLLLRFRNLRSLSIENIHNITDIYIPFGVEFVSIRKTSVITLCHIPPTVSTITLKNNHRLSRISIMENCVDILDISNQRFDVFDIPNGLSKIDLRECEFSRIVHKNAIDPQYLRCDLSIEHCVCPYQSEIDEMTSDLLQMSRENDLRSMYYNYAFEIIKSINREMDIGFVSNLAQIKIALINRKSYNISAGLEQPELTHVETVLGTLGSNYPRRIMEFVINPMDC